MACCPKWKTPNKRAPLTAAGAPDDAGYVCGGGGGEESGGDHIERVLRDISWQLRELALHVGAAAQETVMA